MLTAPSPPTTSTSAPGRASSAGATVRQASGMLSPTAAIVIGSTPSGTGTSMKSGKGTRTRSLSAPPQSPPIGPSPYIAIAGALRQVSVIPARQLAQAPQQIWKGTAKRCPASTPSTVLTDLGHLGDEFVAERKGPGEGRSALDDRRVEVAGGDGEGTDQDLGVALQLRIRRLAPLDRTRFDEGQLAHSSIRLPLKLPALPNSGLRSALT